MLEKIIKALEARNDLKAWSVRRVQSKEIQQYELENATEAQRLVENQQFIVEVLRQTPGKDGEPTCGAGNVTLLPGADIENALHDAALMAGLVHNEPYDFPEPATLPDVPLADETLMQDPAGAVEKVLAQVRDAGDAFPDVRITAVECFGEQQNIHLMNSHGVDVEQVETTFLLDLVFIAGEGDQEVESFTSLTRRRAADLDVQNEVALHAQQTADLLRASPPQNYKGPVVLQGGTLAVALGPDNLTPTMLQLLSSAQLKYTGETPWDVGQSVFKGEVAGDPFNAWANRRLAYGTYSNHFDREGLPGQRVKLIQDNQFTNFTANQRFATYLGIPATGEFGDLEIGPGSSPAAELLDQLHVEISTFSWFNPHPFTGDFACEIRLGYIVDGDKRQPFKGGMLVGNLLDALSNVHWSAETGFFGNYTGPITARFNDLTVAGES